MSNRIINVTAALTIGLAFFLPLSSSAQSVSSGSAFDFGLIEFAPTHYGEIIMGSNGQILITGIGLSTEASTGVPGEINIIGESGTVEIRCDNQITLGSNESSDTLEITNIEVSIGSGVDIGSGTPCTGSSTSNPDAIQIDLEFSSNPKLFFGGVLNIPSGSLSGGKEYKSSFGGGTSLSVSAVFQ